MENRADDGRHFVKLALHLVPLLSRFGKGLLILFLPILLGLLLAAVLVHFMGISPFTFLQFLAKGALGNLYSLGITLQKMVPLLLCGIGICICFQSGLVNVGAEGQLYMGALFGTLAAFVFSAQPGPFPIVMVFVFAFLGGALWGLIPGACRAYLGLNEIIITVMMNYIAFWLVSYLVHGPLRDPFSQGYPWTALLPDSTRWPNLIAEPRVNLGLVVALVAALLSHFLLWNTVIGYELRVSGKGAGTARFCGMNTKKAAVLAMFLGGGLAGLGGISEIAGVQYRLSDFFSPGYGYDAIAVALLARAQPLGAVPAAALFGAIRAGSESVQRSIGVPSAVALVAQATIVLALVAFGCPGFRKAVQRRLKQRYVLGRRLGHSVERFP